MMNSIIRSVTKDLKNVLLLFDKFNYPAISDKTVWYSAASQGEEAAAEEEEEEDMAAVKGAFYLSLEIAPTKDRSLVSHRQAEKASFVPAVPNSNEEILDLLEGTIMVL
ncbi:hypothetical protein RUM44_001134 [Polyplax serrata]|uniref:Uncharacterized protein n=1 Tax=Polyplax serrata TaxID=468196 RepID=A0ABR1BAE5_POLSC